MPKENLTVRIDSEIKKQASELFNSLGMDLSTAIAVFFCQAIRYHGIPFEIKLDEPLQISSSEMEDVEN